MNAVLLVSITMLLHIFNEIFAGREKITMRHGGALETKSLRLNASVV